jgi:hypothetical protein
MSRYVERESGHWFCEWSVLDRYSRHRLSSLECSDAADHMIDRDRWHVDDKDTDMPHISQRLDSTW